MNIGGPAIQITGLMQNLPNLQFDQLLLTGYCDENEVDYLEANKISLPIIRLNGFGRSINLLTDLKVFFEIRKVIKIFDPDIVHTHTAKAGFLGRLAAISIFRKQIRVHTYHGHLLHGYFGKIKTRLLIWIESFLARYTDSLIAVGEKVRDDLIEAKVGQKRQYNVIGPGLNLGELSRRDLALKSLDVPKDKFIVSWIGRAEPVKAPHRLIEVANECYMRKIDIHFVLAGEGKLIGELKERAKSLNLPITFLGWQSEIERVLSFSDLVMLTSENEGTPLALIQAQVAGIPVLTTDVGSASEVLIDEKSGFCLSYSAREFADRIELLCNEPELRASFGAAGKRNAIAAYSVNRLVTDHETLYLELISQSNS
jgi:glycosyltransferase involved in cell wall biosynthesis